MPNKSPSYDVRGPAGQGLSSIVHGTFGGMSEAEAA